MTAVTADPATDEAPTDVVQQNAPATVTVRRSWAIGGFLTIAVVIVAMAIAVAALAGDDGPDQGFPQGAPGDVPGMSGEMTPPQSP